ncbi:MULTISPECIES: hypothetical protein [Photorhabdus]|uniref:DUF5673 domain-containing protein n=1 Tax=Photorhabdus bodei TaxID=2029681 RepID=A0AAW6BNT3_9GAMM|nr:MULTISPECIES: hypothetical protein [Photorhabdus]MCT8354487.1 hypothetical protein [Photorhabdus kayaii]MDB6375103.1 hypothetical protein [Photorhabdus bodei]
MKQIYKMVFVGFAINVLICLASLVATRALYASYDDLSYQLQSVVDKLFIVDKVLQVFIFLQIVNLFIIIKMPKYAKISSFIVSCVFPLGVVYFIGCLLSIQRVTLASFSEYQNDNTESDHTVYFLRDKYCNRAWGWSGGAVLLLIKGLSSICIMMAAMNWVSYRRTKERYFFAKREDGFLLTPTALSKTIFLPYECIERVERREDKVVISVYLNKKIDIVCSNKFIDREALEKVVSTLALAALSNQSNK